MKRIYSNDNMVAVHSAKNILEINGIDCILKNEHSNAMGAVFGTSNLIELWVKNIEDYEVAKSIIEEKITNPQDLANWVCGQCNEQNEGSFEVCWKCQSEKTIE